MKEMVLYYNPKKAAHASKLKSVFVRMGIRIKNINGAQLDETVGYLAGIEGFEACRQPGLNSEAIEEEMLVMKDFSDRRLNELLLQMRKAGIPKIALKAVVTEHNVNWTLRALYKEIKEEHAQMSGEGTSSNVN